MAAASNSPMIPPAGVDAFLAACGWGEARVEPLAGDASFRRYFRVIGDGRSAVLMGWSQEDLIETIVAESLIRRGLMDRR